MSEPTRDEIDDVLAVCGCGRPECTRLAVVAAYLREAVELRQRISEGWRIGERTGIAITSCVNTWQAQRSDELITAPDLLSLLQAIREATR